MSYIKGKAGSSVWSRLPLAQWVCFAAFSFICAHALAQDSDGDTIADSADNCLSVPNVNQRDTDSDGLGNVCDADLNQDCSINFVDVSIFSGRFLSDDADADFNGDGAVNFVDYVQLTNSFLASPGPSGVPNLCSPASSLTLSGSTGPQPIVAGVVSAVIDQTASGGSVIVLNSVTDLDGNFELVIDPANESDFITIAVIGLGGQVGVSLGSLAGSVEALSLAGGNDGTVNSSEAPSLRISPLTTAFSVLASEAQGVDVNNQADLEAVETLVEGGTLLDLTTILSAIIENPAVSLPAGSTDILTFAADEEARRRFRIRLLAEQSVEYNQALAGALAQTAYSFAGQTPDGSLYTTLLYNVGSIGPALHLEFGVGNAVTLTQETKASASWSIDVDGSLVITPDVPLGPESRMVTIDNPDNPGFPIQALQNSFTDSLKIIRLREGANADHVVTAETGFTTFPDYPQLGSAPFATVPDTTDSRLLVDENVSIPFSQMELVNAGMSLYYYHRDNASEGSSPDERGFDTLDFVSDGTGTSRRRQFSFDWEVLASGELSVVFTTGDVNRYRRLISNGDNTTTGSVFYQLNGSVEAATRTFFVSRDETAAFVDPDVANRSYRSALAALSTLELSSLRVFDFVVSESGVACRNPDSPNSTWTWSITDGRLDIFRDLGPSINGFFSRTWDPIRVVDGRYWVIESLQVELDGGPLLDPAMLPGRMNVYSIAHEDTANTRPVLNNDDYATSVDTPIVIYLDDVFGNDVDAEGDEIILRSISSGSQGSFLENQNFQNTYPYAYIYTPPAGFTGVETFVLEASDIACRGDLPAPTSSISITVN